MRFNKEWKKATCKNLDESQLSEGEIKELKKFVKYVVKNSKDLKPRFEKIISKHFWELID